MLDQDGIEVSDEANHQTFESQLLFEDFIEQELALSAPISPEPIVGRHHGEGAALLDSGQVLVVGGMEDQQVDRTATAELFDPDLWASLFAESGARYVVLTSKHHDGFCLWPTKSPFKEGWNSLDVGPKRDLVGDLTAAVRAQGLRMGLYYSMIEWETNRTGRTPSGRFIPQEAMEKYGIPIDRYVDDHVLPQLRELVTGYRSIQKAERVTSCFARSSLNHVG